jgi:hypothetical protein
MEILGKGKRMDKQLQDMTEDELAELRIAYDRQKNRAGKLAIQREIDRRRAAEPQPKADYVLSGAGNIKSDEKFGIIGGE